MTMKTPSDESSTLGVIFIASKCCMTKSVLEHILLPLMNFDVTILSSILMSDTFVRTSNFLKTHFITLSYSR